MELPAIWASAVSPSAEPQPSGADILSYYGEAAEALVAVTYDLNSGGIRWLTWILQRTFVRCRLIVAVYPACATP